jgi:hypothetical protein
VETGELEVVAFSDNLSARNLRFSHFGRTSSSSVDPELHEAATAAIQASGLGVSAWLAEAIALKLAVEERGRERP